ncbi:MAG: carbon storage regulator CsrA [Planctomycetia bacterium]|nr:carbon storage regulator CsrA [Planctomycetia bacterium]
MLVLSRKSQESIVIGGEIEVRIISIRGNMVRLGIEAPKNVSILRSEICEPTREIQVHDLAYSSVAAPCAANHCAV